MEEEIKEAESIEVQEPKEPEEKIVLPTEVAAGEPTEQAELTEEQLKEQLQLKL